MKSIDDFLHELPDRGVQFFVFFSRFEYALKRGDFLFSRGDDDSAYPAWDRFAQALGHRFFDEVRESAKAKTFLSAPPKKQVVKDDVLDWREEGPINTTAGLLVAVRRLRNNLFHGGKFPSGALPVGNPDRDDRLIGEAIEILKMALARCKSVKTAFFEF
jgi:hypothetical protein